MDKQPVTCILASRRNGTLYIGVTSDLVGRIWQHRNHVVSGFSHRYGTTLLVWYEPHETMDSAITSEKRLKKWERAWKVRLMEASNPCWNDLWTDITGQSKVTGSPPSRG